MTENEIISIVINDKKHEDAVKSFKSGKYGMIGYLFGSALIYIEKNNIKNSDKKILIKLLENIFYENNI